MFYTVFMQILFNFLPTVGILTRSYFLFIRQKVEKVPKTFFIYIYKNSTVITLLVLVFVSFVSISYIIIHVNSDYGVYIFFRVSKNTGEPLHS